jgi:hypothetical protein
MDHRTEKKCKTNPTKHGFFGPWINEPCTHLLEKNYVSFFDQSYFFWIMG